MKRSIAAAMGVVLLAACGTTVPQVTQLHGQAASSGISASDAVSGASAVASTTTGAGPAQAITTGAPASDKPAALGVTAGATATTSAHTGGAVVSSGPHAAGSVKRQGLTKATPARGSASAVPGATKAATSTATPVPATTYGIDGTTVLIGIPYAQNSGAALSALGGNGGAVSSPMGIYQALITDANNHGGMFGRKIVADYYPIDVTGDQTTEYQAACSEFTQDKHVYAALGNGTLSYYSCLSAAGVIVLSDALDEATMRSMPTYVAPHDLAFDRYAAAYAPQLNAEGYFSGWNASTGASESGGATIGLLAYSSGAGAESAAATNILLPGLQKYSSAKVVVENVPDAQTDADLATLTSAISGAELAFRSAGVDHVVFMASGGLPESLFLDDAQSQGYKPRYGFTTNESIQADIDAGLITQPSAQLAGALGIGWEPALDDGLAQDTFITTGTARQCIALVTAAGYAPTDSTSAYTATQECDNIDLLVAAAAHAPSITGQSWLAGLASLGSAYVSPATQETYFAADLHDGAAALQTSSFQTSCDCILDSGPTAAVNHT